MDLGSVALAALPLLVCGAFAWAVFRYADEYADWSLAARTGFAAGLVVFGLGASVALTWSSLELARTLVTSADVGVGDDGTAVHTFQVRHPGTEHRLHLIPKRAHLRTANGPVLVSVDLDDPDGVPVLRLEHRFEVYDEAGVDHLDRVSYWREAHLPFTPSRAGPHRLEIQVIEGRPAALGVTVTD